MDWYYVEDRERGERAGPVGEAELKSLHAEGAIGPETLVWREGMDEWQAFAAVFPREAGEAVPGAAPGSPPALPTAQAAPPGGSGVSSFPESGVRGDPAALAAVEYEVRIGQCFSRAWAMFTGPKFGVLLGAGVLVYVVYIGATNIPIVGIAAVLFGWVIFAGLYQYYLAHIRGTNPPFELVFSGFKAQLGPLVLIMVIQMAALFVCMFPALVVALVGTIAEEEAILVGAAVLAVLGFIPWVYLYVAWSFGPVLCLDQGLGPWTALETSRKAVRGHWFQVFFLVLLAALVSMAGMLLLCIGVLFTMPYASLVFAYLYHDAFDRPTKATAPTGPTSQ